MTDEDAAGETAEAEEADASEAEETEANGDAEAGLQEGDFVRLSLTARTVEGGQLVDTTDREVAEEEGVDEEGATFEPRVVPLGEGHIFDAVQDDVVGREVGEEGNVVVPAADAFGEHDPEQVQTVSVDKIPEDDRYPGAHVDVDGQHGHVETIIGGRARVDFNHPLAGEDVEYDYEILDVVEDRIGKAEGLFGMYFDADFDVWVETEEVEREIEPDETGEADAPGGEAAEGEAAESEVAEGGEAESEAAEGETAESEPAEGDGAESEAAESEVAEGGEAESEPAEGEAAESEAEGDGAPEPETELVEEETLHVEVPPQLGMNQQWLFRKSQVARDVMDRLDLDRVVFRETVEGGGMGMGMGGMGGMGGMPGGGDVVEGDVDEVVEELEEELPDDADTEAEAEPE